jgi:hypothetical protein
LEWINYPSFKDIELQDLTVDEKIALKDSTFDVLDKIHALSVYDLDIQVPNVIWDCSSHLVLCDFESATFKTESTMDHIATWVASDRGKLITMLRDYGIKAECPPAPGWFEGSWKFWRGPVVCQAGK